MIKSVHRYNRAASRPPNINIIPHLPSSVNSTDIQTFSLVFMEHPILKIPRAGCNMKIPKRSESNVLTKLTPFKTVERRGYVNDGTQHEYGITLDLRRDSPNDQGLFPFPASRGRRRCFRPEWGDFFIVFPQGQRGTNSPEKSRRWQLVPRNGHDRSLRSEFHTQSGNSRPCRENSPAGFPAGLSLLGHLAAKLPVRSQAW